MSFFRKDWIERQIELVMAALSALLGLRKEERFDDAAALVARTVLELSGLELRVVLTMDPTLVADLVGHPRKIAALARLLREDGRVLRDRGDPACAGRFERAQRFFMEAEARGEPCADERAELEAEADDADRGIPPPPMS